MAVASYLVFGLKALTNEQLEQVKWNLVSHKHN
jgi:hypothetical protein